VQEIAFRGGAGRGARHCRFGLSGDDDKAKQVSDLEDLSAQKIDGVLIFPGDSVMVAEPIKTIFDAQNIPVVITDIGISRANTSV
jgi:ABC-type sugar transport system substrate-binding protein